MSMEKQGIVNEHTPSEKQSQCCGGKCGTSKTAADLTPGEVATLKDPHATTRAADAVSHAAKK